MRMRVRGSLGKARYAVCRDCESVRKGKGAVLDCTSQCGQVGWVAGGRRGWYEKGGARAAGVGCANDAAVEAAAAGDGAMGKQFENGNKIGDAGKRGRQREQGRTLLGAGKAGCHCGSTAVRSSRGAAAPLACKGGRDLTVGPHCVHWWPMRAGAPWRHARCPALTAGEREGGGRRLP